MEIEPFQPIHAVAVSSLVRQVFDEHVAASFGPEGIAEMHEHVAPEAIAERATTHLTLVAREGGEEVGVIEVRNSDHISMLFVKTALMGKGIASALVEVAEEVCRAAGREAMTVNSSLNAQSYYERMGFRPTDEPQRLHGFAFVPMEKRLSIG
jgi:predicted N-acetyltransferase YhbS